MKWRLLLSALLLAAAAAALAWPGLGTQRAQTQGPPFEVWALDQSDTHLNGGGLLYIWQGEDLLRRPDRAVPEVIDLANAAQAARCPVGKLPHMGQANNSYPPTHFVLANFGSGSVFFMEIATRRVVGCVDLLGLGVASNRTHAAMATPDDSMVIVADMGFTNQSTGAIHKISTDYRRNRYRYVETLDLAPYMDELGPNQARAVCVNFTPDSRFAYVTLQQGGLLVVDLGRPNRPGMRVVHVYPASLVPAEGCGAIPLPPDGWRLLVNSESRGNPNLPDQMYIFDARGAAQGVFPDPVIIPLPGEDTHGAFYCVDDRGKLYAWTVMRMSNDLNIVDVDAARVVRTYSLVRGFLPDPAPDGLELMAGHAFITLRGPKPLSAMTASVNPERTPGVLVLRVHKSCLQFDFDVGDLAPMVDSRTTTITVGGVTVTVPASDPHGLDVIPR
jgi:hypothetical protein